MGREPAEASQDAVESSKSLVEFINGCDVTASWTMDMLSTWYCHLCCQTTLGCSFGKHACLHALKHASS